MPQEKNPRPHFTFGGQTLRSIHEARIQREKDLQKLTEKNLSTIFGLQFVRTEFTIGRFRLDTIAFDKKKKNFVIIEYKRGGGKGIIEQCLAYRRLPERHPADFVLAYNEATGKRLGIGDVKWRESKVLVLAKSFTHHQVDAVSDPQIELWVVQLYENNTMLYRRLYPSRTGKPAGHLKLFHCSDNGDIDGEVDDDKVDIDRMTRLLSSSRQIIEKQLLLLHDTVDIDRTIRLLSSDRQTIEKQLLLLIVQFHIKNPSRQQFLKLAKEKGYAAGTARTKWHKYRHLGRILSPYLRRHSNKTNQ